MDDLKKWRFDTPGCEKKLHFNNAGSSLPTSLVLSGMVNYLKDEAMNGGYETFDDYEVAHKKVYESVARLINAKSSEIALVDGATRAWDLALSSIPFKKGDVILTSSSEYVSNYLALLQFSKKIGVVVKFIPNDEFGQTSISALKEMATSEVKLIAITHVPSTNGMINPLDGISDIAKSCGAFFLLDACQSIGQLKVDAKKIGCDFLAATGRKFLRAPRGTGFLYIKEETLNKYNLEPLFVDFAGASMNFDGTYKLEEGAARFEMFETSYAARIGLGIAAEYALMVGLEKIEERILELSKTLRSELQKIKKISLHDTGVRKSGIVTFSIEGVSAKDFSLSMRAKNINLSTTTKEMALDLYERKIDSVMRASIHYYNSEREIASFIRSVKEFLT